MVTANGRLGPFGSGCPLLDDETPTVAVCGKKAAPGTVCKKACLF
jgi:hypothetical protein